MNSSVVSTNPLEYTGIFMSAVHEPAPVGHSGGL